MKYLLVIFVAVGALFASVSEAQEVRIEYKDGIVVDSDLDGLTDEGERQLFGTDPKKADSDGDGFLDGAEVLSGTDPSDADFYPGRIDLEEVNSLIERETPWAWYVSRASGIVAYIFLWLTILLGLSIRNPILKKIIAPIYSFSLHCFLAGAAVFWALIHGTVLLFDRFIGFGVKDVAIPYLSKATFVDTNYLALGIMAFYAMVIMTVTSYLKKYLNFWVWRVLHFLHPVAFIFVVLHGYVIGTDMKIPWVSLTYRLSAAFLVLIYFSSLVFMIIRRIKKKEGQIIDKE